MASESVTEKETNGDRRLHLNVAVSKLAEFVHRRGDIDSRLEEVTTSQEGILSQQGYQARRSIATPDYESEVVCSRTFETTGAKLTVLGRVDGIFASAEGSEVPVIEEIKTTRLDPSVNYASRSDVHLAQVKIYSAMLAQTRSFDSCVCRVTYIHPDTLASEHFDSEHQKEELNQFFEESATEFLHWHEATSNRVAERNTFAKKQSFPFPSFLEDQRKLAAQVFVSIRDSQHLLLSAPTGSGKSMTTLFPSVKAMGEEQLDRAVFLTARTTGQAAAVSTLATLSGSNPELTFASISAKDRICFTEDMPCSPDKCEYAAGHYDRVREATQVLLTKRMIVRETTETVARGFKVCPFELQLDAAEWADVVVGDYNYVFDPYVALARLHTAIFRQNALLIDEAHRLTDRVKDMLHVELSESLLAEALEEQLPADTKRRIATLVQEFNRVTSGLNENLVEIELDSNQPVFWKCVNQVFTDMSEPHKRILLQSDRLRALYFALFKLRTAREREDFLQYFWVAEQDRDCAVIKILCLDASFWIRERVTPYKSTVRFSGTLTPPAIYNASHGIEAKVAKGSFSTVAERLRVFVVPSISTYYRHRANTLSTLAGMIENLVLSSSSNWLIAFPSFAYLRQAAAEVSDSLDLRVQEPNMSLNAREEFLEWMNEPDRRAGFVVMGGVFAESIDYERNALAGVLVVGPGIPPRSLARERIKETADRGYELAYRQPAMARSVQAAGRVLRGAHDRGVVVLVDPRFTHEECAVYFPNHWQPQIVSENDLYDEVAKFLDDS